MLNTEIHEEKGLFDNIELSVGSRSSWGIGLHVILGYWVLWTSLGITLSVGRGSPSWAIGFSVDSKGLSWNLKEKETIFWELRRPGFDISNSTKYIRLEKHYLIMQIIDKVSFLDQISLQ